MQSKFYLNSLVRTTWEFFCIVCKTRKAPGLEPLLEVLIAAITPIVWPPFTVTHQTLAIAMAWVSTVHFVKVMPEAKCKYERLDQQFLGLPSANIAVSSVFKDTIMTYRIPTVWPISWANVLAVSISVSLLEVMLGQGKLETFLHFTISSFLNLETCF